MPFAADLALEEAAESLDTPCPVDLARVTRRRPFSGRRQALGFPDWYGHNWDALADCLTDLSWMAADGYVDRPPERADAFASAAPTDFATALSSSQDAADTWRGTACRSGPSSVPPPTASTGCRNSVERRLQAARVGAGGDHTRRSTCCSSNGLSTRPVAVGDGSREGDEHPRRHALREVAEERRHPGHRRCAARLAARQPLS